MSMNLFDTLAALARANAEMYRMGRRHEAERINDEMNHRIEAEDIPAKLVEDSELEE